MSAHKTADRGKATTSVTEPADVTPREQEAPAPRSALPVPADQPVARSAIAVLQAALNTMVNDIDALAEAGDLEALAHGYAALDQFVRAARDVRNHAEDHIARLMTSKTVNLNDQVTLERHQGTVRRQWQSVELLRHLVGDQLVDAATGEDVTDRLVACLPLTGSLAWRAGALRDHGVDPDQWCEASPARPTVSVRKAKP
jgi:hypothetical protein